MCILITPTPPKTGFHLTRSAALHAQVKPAVGVHL
jgi:hypothetical protein